MIRFYVIGDGGEILRHGSCIEADAPLQGEKVVTWPIDDPVYSDAKYLYDAASDSFVAKA